MSVVEVRRDQLFDLLPLVYRMRDDDENNALRDLLRLIGEQADVVETDIARQYDNWFIETAEDWVVPYLADLIGWTPVAPVAAVAASDPARDLARTAMLVPRRDVANTIRHRRRKGTRSVLSELAFDVAGWPGHVVEFFQRLRVNQHVNHLRVTRGRTVEVREVEVLESIDSAFDVLAHTVDVRRAASARTIGFHNIPSVGLFVWRLGAYRVTRTPAGRISRSAYTFDATGADRQLFTVGAPSNSPRATVLDVPGPITRRAFETTVKGEGTVTPGYYGEDASFTVWAPNWPTEGAGRPVPASAMVPADLGSWTAYAPKPGTIAVDPVRGRLQFPRHNPPKRVYVSYHYGLAADIGGGEYGRPVATVRPGPPDDTGEQPPPWYRAVASTKELSDALETWTREAPARALVEFTDSDVYSTPIELQLAAHQALVLRAGARIRPVLIAPERRAALSAILADGSDLTLDGLIVAGGPVHIERATAQHREDGHVEDGEASDKHPCEGPPRLMVRHCTLGPGWLPDAGCEPNCPPPNALELVDCDDAAATICHSIVGPIQVDAERRGGEQLDLSISDSIVDASGPGFDAIFGSGAAAGYARLRIARATVFGQVHVHAIDRAQDSIFEGIVKVARRAGGCMRFCSLVPDSRTPQRFHCQPDLAVAALGPSATVTTLQVEETHARVRPRFTSTDFGDPGYAQLSCHCPGEVCGGAEDESEMGAFHDLYEPQRMAALRARATEYTPAAMDVAVIPVT